MKRVRQKVSILLPTHNPSNLIKKSIEGVLTQGFQDFELIIIDDGSRFNLKEILKEFSGDPRVKILRNDKNLGIQKSLNRGLRKAQGKYIARIDDDDEWVDKDKLKAQVEFLDKNRNYVLLGCGAIFIDEKGKELERYFPPEKNNKIRKVILRKNCFIHSSVVFRKKAALKLGGYNQAVETRHVEDYDLWLKLGTVGLFANLPLLGVRFLVREDSISSKNILEQIKKNIYLTKKYSSFYPNYIFSLFWTYGRLVFYKFINIFSPLLLRRIISFKRRLIYFFRKK